MSLAEPLVIAGFLLRELLRRKLLWLLLSAAALGLLLYGYGIYGAVESAGGSRMGDFFLIRITTTFLGFGQILSGLVAVLAAAGTVAGELESGRVQLVLTRAITRRQWYLGQFVGLGVLVTSFSAVFYLATAVIYAATAGPLASAWWTTLPLYPLGPLALLALTMLLSTAAGTITAGAGGFVAAVLAMIGGGLETLAHFMNHEALRVASLLISLLFPSQAAQGRVSHLLSSGIADRQVLLQIASDVAPPPSAAMTVYTVLYIVLLLAWGSAALRSRDL